MRRRASPSARTIRIAPTAPCVPVDRDGAPVPRSDPPDAGPVTGKTAPARAWKVDRSVAQGRPSGPRRPDRPDGSAPARRWLAVAGGLLAGRRRPGRLPRDAHRSLLRPLRLAGAAFLEGQAAIRYPVASTADDLGNCVLPGRPADRHDRRRRRAASCRSRRCRPSCSLPFVAVWGLATDDQAIFTVLAAIDVAICWWMLGRLPVRAAVRLATTIFFAFGTVFWYTAQLATTWYQAHIVAVGLALLAVGLALGARPAAQRRTSATTTRPTGGRRRPRRARGRAGRAARCADRPPPVPRRVPVRPGLHGPPDGRLRGAVLRLRRWRAAAWLAARLVGRARGGDPGRASCSPTTSSRPGTSSTRPTTTSTSSRPRGYPALGYHADWAHRGPALPAAEPRRSCSSSRPTSLPAPLPDTPRRRRPAASARSPAPRAACSTSRARWPSRATSG